MVLGCKCILKAFASCHSSSEALMRNAGSNTLAPNAIAYNAPIDDQ